MGDELRYRLVRRPRPPAPAQLDDHQQAVVAHRDGPLLVLAGPGTGKTTTLVEAVVDRVQGGLAPEQVLVLTFSRKAALELRDRISARLGRATSEPVAWTFHAFAYALVRAEQPPDLFTTPLRLLTGPEQDIVVRDLLLGGKQGQGTVRWPASLLPCLDTYGFRDEVRTLLSRARETGLDPAGLAGHAERAARDDWAACAGFFAEYLDVLDHQQALDYPELVHRAVLTAERADVLDRLRRRYAVVFVDEYQDTDPAQERLLAALAGDGRDLVVVGDPDQSVYGFRGAEVRNILEFRHRFPTRDGRPAPVRTLRRSRRAGERLLASSRAVAARLSLAGLPAQAVRAHRALEAQASGSGEVSVCTFPSTAAELDHVADVLRRAHLENAVPWQQMAVLVRSGVRSVPLVRRTLGAAGVPVEVAADELPLGREPAVTPLLAALECAADPATLTAERARTLLLSPLGGLDSPGLRRLGRALRADERLAASSAAPAGPEGGSRPVVPRTSDDLLREALAEPATLVAPDPDVAEDAAPVRRLGLLIRETRAVVEAGGTPEEALWVLWSGTSWPRRLERTVHAGGPARRSADRDLDAVCALFEAAARAEQRRGHRGVLNFLAEVAAQQIPGGARAERSTRGDAVRLLTAHRAKGLEWRLVAVVGVQEGVWPDLRRRGSLLQPDTLGPDGLREPPTAAAMLAEERRLFYVAVTRARERLLVTAVDSSEDDGERPSRFLDDLGVQPTPVLGSQAHRPMSVAGLVAELRAVTVDEQAGPALREAAARRLARLASARDEGGRPLVPSADPASWWGMADVTDPGVPVHERGRPVRMSGSALQGVRECPLRWFLRHEVHAQSPPSSAVGFGSVLHVLADEVARGVTPASLDELTERLDQVWGRLAFEAPWQSAQQRDQARAALERFCRWHLAERGRTMVSSEHAFEVSLEVGETEVLLRGSMDRVEVDAAGRVHVVDFKTGKSTVSGADLDEHAQLGAYQLAVREGALDTLDTSAGVPVPTSGLTQTGGAELVQLRADVRGHPKVQQQEPLAGAAGTTWVDRLVAEVVGRVLTETFPPRRNDGCDRCEFRVSCPARPEGRQVVA